MKTFSYTFGAGETKQFPSGRFFIAITAGDAINVDFKRSQVKLDESAQGVTSGYFVDFEDKGFDLVEIYSATAQTVKVAISHGTGGFNITSQIVTDILGGTIDEVKPVNGGVSVNSAYGTTSNSLVTIVTPAANTNGVEVTGAILLNGGSANTIRVMYDTSAPALYYNGVGIIGVQASNENKCLSYPIIIPAGYGLYKMAGSATSHSYEVVYDIL